MNKIIIILISLIAITISSCGVTYNTQSGGLSDVGYIIVLSDQKAMQENVVLHLDGKSYPINKVYKTAKYQKAKPIITSPGQHKVEVSVNGEPVFNQNILIGLQETRKIILQ